MAIYWIIWVLICIFLLIGHKNIFSKILFSLFCIFLFLFIGFRYEVGGDWGNYIRIYYLHKYINLSQSLAISDPAYSLLNYFSQYLGFKDTIFVNACCGLIISTSLYFSFKKQNKYWLLMLIYYPYHILSVSLGYTRQSVALAILIYAFTFLIQKNIFKFTIYVTISALFHKTSIIFLLFIPLIYIKKRYQTIIFTLTSISIVTALLYLSSKSESNIYTNPTEDLTSSGVFMRLSMHTIPIVVYFIANRTYLNKIGATHIIRILDYFITLIIFCSVLAIPFSTLSDRFNLYLVIFDLLVISQYTILRKNNQIILLISLILYHTLFIYIWLFYSHWAARAWIPYSNYISNYLINIF